LTGAAGQQPAGRWALFVETIAALAAPRRAVPILLVTVPLVLAQHRFSPSGQAVWVAVAMCVLFLTLAPFTWRVLVSRGASGRLQPLLMLVYGLIGGLPAALGWLLPEAFGLGETFLTAGINIFVSAALFWVGGWGLARDIDLELGLERERARSQALAREAERAQLLAIRAQLDPHFLFNTLNAIAEYCREDGALAERAILQLSALLRRVLEGAQAATWPLQDELALARDLVSLHRIRDPERFELRWEPEPGYASVPVPPLLLLPLVENAMKHGPGAGHRGTVSLELVSQGDSLRLRLRNPGPYRGPREGGQGLDNVRRRLELAYVSAILELREIEHDGAPHTLTELVLPLAGPSEEAPT
jgi:two-component system sensor histidine kinase AlgZ